jgi:hypothetical protein
MTEDFLSYLNELEKNFKGKIRIKGVFYKFEKFYYPIKLCFFVHNGAKKARLKKDG